MNFLLGLLRVFGELLMQFLHLRNSTPTKPEEVTFTGGDESVINATTDATKCMLCGRYQFPNDVEKCPGYLKTGCFIKKDLAKEETAILNEDDLDG